jgi:hypothetical protein
MTDRMLYLTAIVAVFLAAISRFLALLYEFLTDKLGMSITSSGTMTVRGVSKLLKQYPDNVPTNVCEVIREERGPDKKQWNKRLLYLK